MKPDFFTRPRYSVPHDRIGPHWMLLVHQAVTLAFEMIRAEGFDLANANENAITERLEDMLENRIRNRDALEGFDVSFIASVTRSRTVNFDGTKISKEPDLSFRLRREHRTDWDQRQDALFAECKPVDKKHKLKGHYCAISKDCTGIERFVIGDYAWAMEQALMIAYVRDGYRIHPHLAEELANSKTRAGLGEPSELHPVGYSAGIANPLYCSTHRRSFSWLNGRPATLIDLYHSWHDATVTGNDF